MTFVTTHATRRLMLDYNGMRRAEAEAVRALRGLQEQRALYFESLFHLRWLRSRKLRREERPVP